MKILSELSHFKIIHKIPVITKSRYFAKLPPYKNHKITGRTGICPGPPTARSWNAKSAVSEMRDAWAGPGSCAHTLREAVPSAMKQTETGTLPDRLLWNTRKIKLYFTLLIKSTMQWNHCAITTFWVSKNFFLAYN